MVKLPTSVEETLEKKSSRVISLVIFTSFSLSVILFPVFFPTDQSSVYLTYAAVFGILGNYARYQLSFLNTTYKTFPLGNILQI
jgi:hypothetical protein